MKAYPMHLHLHCSHEPTASIGSHMSHAKELGICHIWTTEHDTRMGKKAKDIPFFAFCEKQLFVTLENGAKAGFQEEEGNTGTYNFEENEKGISLWLIAKENELESMLFYSIGKRHCDPLFSQLAISLDAEIERVHENGCVVIEFVLSAQPPSYKQAKLCYVMGELPQAEENIQYLPFPEKKDGVYQFNLTKDAGEEIGGLDNALCNIRLLVENGAKMQFHSLSFDRALNFQEVREEQIKLAQKLGKKWGVTPFVAFEITGAGNHKNCFSTKVPVIDYREFDYKVSNEQAIAHVKEHGGIFSWNHPFTPYSKREESRESIIAEVAQKLIDNRVYGASIMEVGFPFGRDGFEAKDYLNLWDMLSENGIFITGDGDSDNHHAVADGWTERNNFCAFVGLFDTEAPTEENFVAAFKRGSVWAGNPVKIRKFNFSAGEKPQGSVVSGRQVRVEFNASDIHCGGYALCIVNGEQVKRIEIEHGKVEGAFMLFDTQKYNFARVEIYDEKDVLIAFSNPIYLVKKAEDIPLDAIESGRYERK